jgi:NADP-dependent aldehyde dehydrogenase
MDMVEELLETMQGQLVACVYAEPQELSDASSLSRKLLTCLMDAAGRVVVNCVPTGVRVCEAMVHSGPFPASNAPETTAVGMRAIERWCRPVCLQNWPAEALPDGLRG